MESLLNVNVSKLIESTGANLEYSELCHYDMAVSQCGQKATLVFCEHDMWADYCDEYLQRPVEADPDVLISHDNTAYHEDVIDDYPFRFAWMLSAAKHYVEIQSFVETRYEEPRPDEFIIEAYKLLKKGKKISLLEHLYRNDEKHFSFYDQTYFNTRQLMIDSGRIGELAVPLLELKDGSYSIVDSDLATHMYRIGEHNSRDRKHRWQLEDDYLASMNIDDFEWGAISIRNGRLHLKEPAVIYEVEVDPVFDDAIGHASFTNMDDAKAYLKSLKSKVPKNKPICYVEEPKFSNTGSANPLLTHFRYGKVQALQREVEFENALIYYRSKLNELESLVPFHKRKRQFVVDAWEETNREIKAVNDGECYLLGELEVELRNGIPICNSLERVSNFIGFDQQLSQVKQLTKRWSETYNRLN
ncbi:hypothetical protein [Photobacterium lutimaris]|uniref:Uncharacterized protein n=1 Tax=Photobacterium lutimaris TaxID=388278 RepID=A0A2T3ITT7_9GAMM|nr:hypothetical protein [Photobacterium lutimaris]PSU31774.1 hypothetical protein C9I99_21560 [Photobacterium lutimaris]TDR72574.1 hypothetical protein DFP78_11350 [Photobacterium lutimaris]